MIDFIEITQDNILQALNENLRRLAIEVQFKLPANGSAVLLGDYDFQGLYTIYNVTPIGPETAYNNYGGSIELLGEANGLYLDGSWFLDGTFLLNGVRNNG